MLEVGLDSVSVPPDAYLRRRSSSMITGAAETEQIALLLVLILNRHVDNELVGTHSEVEEPSRIRSVRLAALFPPGATSLSFLGGAQLSSAPDCAPSQTPVKSSSRSAGLSLASSSGHGVASCIHTVFYPPLRL